MTITAESMQWALRHMLRPGQGNYEIPNCHFFDFEIDYLLVRKSMYCEEFEIKRSVSDFNADFKKTVTIRKIMGSIVDSLQEHEVKKIYNMPVYMYEDYFEQRHLIKDEHREVLRVTKVDIEVLKHTAIRLGHYMANRFSFVIPEELLEKIQPKVPENYGLYIVTDRERCREIIKPKLLHKNKLTPADLIYILRKTYYRYWDMKVAEKSRLRSHSQRHLNQ